MAAVLLRRLPGMLKLFEVLAQGASLCGQRLNTRMKVSLEGALLVLQRELNLARMYRRKGLYGWCLPRFGA